MAGGNKNKFLTVVTDELREKLNVAEELYVNLKFEHATKGLENPMELRTVRRDIARMNTELRAREIKQEASTEEE